MTRYTHATPVFCQRARRRRGSSYVMVLSLATVMTVVGFSAVTVSRVNTRANTQANQWTDAQFTAFSASEHALASINADSDWRTTYNGVTVERTINGKTFSWQVVDEGDGDLTDDASDPAVLRVTGATGQAAYALKVDLTIPAASGGGSSGGTMTYSDKTLWGVDNDDGMLFSIDDYTSSSPVVTRYGKLKYLWCGSPRNVGDDVEAFTIDRDGYAYIISNDPVGSLCSPVLLKFNLDNASTTANNIVEVVGRINWNSDVTGMDLDPTTGTLYAMGYAGSSHGDRLLILNKATGAITQNVGEMRVGGTKIKWGNGLAFNEDGELFVHDEYYDRMYRINKSTAAIVETVDGNMTSSGYYEDITWDPINDRMLGSNTGRHELFEITFRTGHNVFWFDFDSHGLSLKDVEGMGFRPDSSSSSSGSTNVRPVPTPSAVQRVVQSN